MNAFPIWLKFETHSIRLALALARAKTGSRREAKIPMIAMTTRTSTRVKPLTKRPFLFLCPHATLSKFLFSTTPGPHSGTSDDTSLSGAEVAAPKGVDMRFNQ